MWIDTDFNRGRNVAKASVPDSFRLLRDLFPANLSWIQSGHCDCFDSTVASFKESDRTKFKRELRTYTPCVLPWE